jgi:hypothetical protein
MNLNIRKSSYLVALNTCALFNSIVNNSDYLVSNDWLVMENELKRLWK